MARPSLMLSDFKVNFRLRDFLLDVLACLVPVQVCADEFFGYYTRLDYTIPIDQAEDYIPTELTEKSLLIIERMEALARAAGADNDEDEDEDEDEDDED